jgi:hypothetical protein
MVKKGRTRRARARARARGETRRLPAIEQHHYYSKMAFDGKTLVSESQKDNEHVRRRVYTLNQLKREIPLAGKFVEEHLDGVIPEAMNRPIPKEIEFRSVLPNPADLGLLPPRESRQRRQRFRTVRRLRHSPQKRRFTAATDADQENMRLVVNDIGGVNGRRRDVFSLPM